MVFPSLDALRGVAAFAVVVGHVIPFLFAPLEGQHFGVKGLLAVDLFFVISGIVVEHAYGRRLAEGMSFGAFFRVRFIRLYPLYILGFALTSYSYLRQPGLYGLLAEFPRWTTGILMLPTPISGGGRDPLYPIMVVAWSLFAEIVVNLFYALIYRWWTTRILLIAIALSAIGVIWSNAYHFDFDNGATWNSLHIALLRCSYGFLLGVLFRRSFCAALARRSLTLTLCLLVGAGLVFNLSLRFRYAISLAELLSFETLQLLVIPAIALVGLHVSPPQRLQSACTLLGAVSYPLYCLHPGSAFLLPQTSSIGTISLYLLGLLAISAAADRFYDRPVRAWLTRKLA